MNFPDTVNAIIKAETTSAYEPRASFPLPDYAEIWDDKRRICYEVYTSDSRILVWDEYILDYFGEVCYSVKDALDMAAKARENDYNMQSIDPTPDEQWKVTTPDAVYANDI